MQKPNNCNNGGVVQWVIPPVTVKPIQNKINNQSGNSINNTNHQKRNNINKLSSGASTSSSSIYHNSSNGKEKGIYNENYKRRFSDNGDETPSGERIIAKTSEIPFIDPSTYRTICTLVEEHLKELKEHQRLINRARSNLICSPNHNNSNNNTQQVDYLDITYIARNDTFKLKVRDEQTRAIETIKQLTNYLRELSQIEAQYNNTNGNDTRELPSVNSTTTNRLHAKAKPVVDEEIITKLSDLRSEIIQALNNFVLSNSDIDVPIIDTDDISKYDYDLCIDAKQTSRQFNNKKKLTDLTNSQNSSSIVSSSASGGSTVNSSNHQNKKYSPNTSDSLNDNLQQKPPLIILNDNSKQQQVSNPPLTLIKSPSASTLFQQQQQSTLNLERRSREIQKLERDTVELRRLFTDFYNLVKVQGEQVDTIEDNIVIATHRISEGQHNLNRSMRGLTIIMPVTGCMAGALIGGPIGLIVGGKLGGITIGCATSLLGLISSYSAQRCITTNKLKHN